MNIEFLKPDSEKPKLPGGELKGQPVQGPDGKWYDQFGEQIEHRQSGVKPEADKDIDYAGRFWARQPKGMREAMEEIIRDAAKDGFISDLVGPGGIDEARKEKLSAYRRLAMELGYEIGKFQFKKGPNIVMAEIKKIEKDKN